MTTIQCPHCNVSLDGEADPGDEIECPACGQTFVFEPPKPQPSKRPAIRVPSGVSSTASRPPLPQSNPVPQYQGAGFVGSIIATLVFFPAGYPALLFSALAHGANKAGDAKRAVGYAAAARVLQLLVLLIVLGFLLMCLGLKVLIGAMAK